MDLPDLCMWGWKEKENKYKTSRRILPEAFVVCNELIRCDCNKEKGCTENCKCLKILLKCTAYSKCHGDCER